MKERQDILKDYLSDMLGLEKHIDSVIDRQADDSKMQKYVQAHDLVTRISQVLKAHQASLEKTMDNLGGEGAKLALKKATTTITGLAANIYSKVRTEDPVSRSLRDNYTALNMAAISYTMLHTTALALREKPLADLALKHLEDLTPLIMQLSEIIPEVVARELAQEGKAIIDPGVASEAAGNAKQAWRPKSSGI